MSEPVVWPTLMTHDEYLRRRVEEAEVKGWNDALDAAAGEPVEEWADRHDREHIRRHILALGRTVAQREPDPIEQGVAVLRHFLLYVPSVFTEDELQGVVRAIIEPAQEQERNRVLDAVQGLMARGGLGVGWMQAITDLRKGRS